MNFLIFVTAFIVLACVVLPLGVLVAFAAVGDADASIEAPPDRPAAPPAPRQTVIT